MTHSGAYYGRNLVVFGTLNGGGGALDPPLANPSQLNDNCPFSFYLNRFVKSVSFHQLCFVDYITVG